MSTHTDYAYRLAARRRSRAMATPMTPADKFWLVYFSAVVIVVTIVLAFLAGLQ